MLAFHVSQATDKMQVSYKKLSLRLDFVMEQTTYLTNKMLKFIESDN